MQELDTALNSRNFIVGKKLTYADIAVWAELKSMFNFTALDFFRILNCLFSSESKKGKELLENNEKTFNNVRQWYEFFKTNPLFQLNF